MAQLQTTKHAYERFKQRILPLLCKNTRKQYSGFHEFNEVMLAVSNEFQDVINKATHKIIKIKTFVTLANQILIPITLVIEVQKRKIITLYTVNGWERITNGKTTTWRWLC